MQSDTLTEARRQVEICNACRYCEGFCAVFPAITRRRAFAEGDLTQLANLCHDCRGCYYACQYTEPHEFALNLPKVLAELRHDSWEAYVWPGCLARAFNRSGTLIAGLMAAAIAAIIFAIQSASAPGGDGFYAYLPHNAMVAIFVPAFLVPLAIVGASLRRFWREVGGKPVHLAHLSSALSSAAAMTNLGGGHGEGCNFEDQDRYSNARRWSHQATMYGFLLCFAATSAGTVLHYGFALPAPYGLISLPKLFGVSGGLLLSGGTFALWALKRRADSRLGDRRSLSGEYAFVVLLFLVSTSGLLLYAATGTALVPALLSLHLGAVLALFLLMPYSKMMHGFFRFAALTRNAQ